MKGIHAQKQQACEVNTWIQKWLIINRWRGSDEKVNTDDKNTVRQVRRESLTEENKLAQMKNVSF